MVKLRVLFITVVMGVVFVRGASGQSADSARVGVSRLNLISTNPIGIIFEWYNGEFERAVAPTASLAVAASHFEFDSFVYTNFDGIVRYYPGAEALRGFSFGGSVGYLSAKDDECVNCEDLTAFTLGVRGDYVWIMGRDQHFTVAAGLGAKRVFYKESDNDGSEGLPIGRLSVGWAW